MERLIAPLGIRAGIFRCLKAGVNPEYPVRIQVAVVDKGYISGRASQT